jgi:hypothetical protein
LSLYQQAKLIEFVIESRLVNGLKKARAEFAVNCEGGIKNEGRDLVFTSHCVKLMIALFAVNVAFAALFDSRGVRCVSRRFLTHAAFAALRGVVG